MRPIIFMQETIVLFFIFFQEEHLYLIKDILLNFLWIMSNKQDIVVWVPDNQKRKPVFSKNPVTDTSVFPIFSIFEGLTEIGFNITYDQSRFGHGCANLFRHELKTFEFANIRAANTDIEDQEYRNY